MNTKASRMIIVGVYGAAIACLAVPALANIKANQDRPRPLPTVSPAGGDLQSGTTILCDGRWPVPRCATYPPGVPVPEWPSRPIPYRPLPTDSSGALVLDGTR